MRRFRLELAANGYLLVPSDVAAEFFAEDACVALWREPELWLLPLRAANSGGLLMKQRNADGDRAVLVHEALPAIYESGIFDAFWDEDNGAIRIAMVAGPN